MSYLKELRIYKKLTQVQACEVLGICRRTYITYENDKARLNTRKYCNMVETLERYNPIDGTHGLVTVKAIKKACSSVFQSYPIERCILLGDYANGVETESSTIELLVFSNSECLGLNIITERLKDALHKSIILIDARSCYGDAQERKQLTKGGKRVYKRKEE